MTTLSIRDFVPARGKLCSTPKSCELTCGALESARAFYAGPDVEERFANARYLWVDVCSDRAPFASPVVCFEFWGTGSEAEEPDLTVRLTCLPQVKTRLVFPLGALDAQHIFLERTPGRFRGFVTGTRVERVGRFAVGLREYWSDQSVTIGNIVLDDEMPELPVPEVAAADALGQWAQRDWSGKSRSEGEVVERLQGQLAAADAGGQALPDRSPCGGWTRLRLTQGTGFFSTTFHRGRHYLVDPDGYAFFSAGVDGASPSIECPVEVTRPFFTWLPPEEGVFADAWEERRGAKLVDFLKVNLIRAFGENWLGCWTRIARSKLREWGFNTIGNWSILSYCSGNATPYVHSLNGFPATDRTIYRDFPDVFSPAYAERSAAYAAQLVPLRDDRYMIGYFMRNEPEWGFAADLEIARELLESPDRELCSKRALRDHLAGVYGTVGRLNASWKTALRDFDDLLGPVGTPRTAAGRADLDEFSRVLIREYVRVPAQALRKADPNHLNLGMRYAFILYPNQCAGKEFMDVFSINCYKIDPSKVLESVAGLVQMPVLIGEFHFGSIDRGLGSTGIIGVLTQRDRGLAYQCYLEACAANPCCVGAHWFTLYDQSCLGRGDGENYQIGLLDVCNRPYEDFIAGVMHTHERLYPLIACEIPPEHPQPQTAKSNIAS